MALSSPGGRIKLTMVGIQALVAQMKKAGDRGMKACGAGLYAVANNIMTDSKEHTPVDLGNLRASGYVTLPQGRGVSELVVEVGYGGTAASYAVTQHEATGHVHPVGEAKFLENALGRYNPQDFLQFTVQAYNENKGATPTPSMPQVPK